MSLIECKVVGHNLDKQVALCDRFNAIVIKEDGSIKIMYLENKKFEYIDLQVDKDKYSIVLSSALDNKGSLFLDIKEGSDRGYIVI